MRKKIETLIRYIFRVRRVTETLVDNDDKTAVVRRHDLKSAVINLAHFQGHRIGATRIHDLPEAILADRRSPSGSFQNIDEKDRLN